MEQWRWMPDQLGDFYVWVNVPEFMLRVVKDGQVIHTERVIVGKPETPTPVFSQDLEQVIFHPSWGVPESIKRQDILPSLDRGSTRLFTHYKLRIQRGGRDVDPRQWIGRPPTSAISTSTSRPARPTCWASSNSASPTSTTSTCTTRRTRNCSMLPSAPSATAACACATPAARRAAAGGGPGLAGAARRRGRQRRAAEQPGQFHPQGPRPHHLLHRRGGRGRQAQAVRRHLRPRAAHRPRHGRQGAPDRATREGRAAGASRGDRPPRRDRTGGAVRSKKEWINSAFGNH